MQALILLVDDEPAVRSLCAATLTGEYRVLEAENGQEALRLLYQHKPALVLLDLTMPVLDGWETLRRIRELTPAPVILVSALGSDAEVARGLAAGAQDFVIKPFSPLQLLSRVRATLRDDTASASPMDDKRLSFDEGRLVVDVGRRVAMVNGQDAELSATEYKVLELLARQPGRVLSQDQILESVWGPEYRGEPGYVKTFVGLIRKKIEADASKPRYLHTRRGLGYVMDVKQ
jgi:two-component system KDP operon response regulator KdpE